MEARAAALDEMETLAAFAAERKLTEVEEQRFAELEAEVADLDKRAKMAASAEAYRAAQPTAKAPTEDIRSAAKQPTAVAAEVREISPYAEKADTSWFSDQRTVKDRYASDADVAEARERLLKHYSASRDEGGVRQVRALTTTTDTEGGYLVAPAHLQEQFVRLMVAGATTSSLVSKRPLPPKTDSINVPTMDGATAVAVHTQNNALTETSATFSTVRCDVLRYGGAQTIPNFLLERSLPGVDGIVMQDLALRLALKVNTDIVGGTGTGTTAIEGILNADSIGTATATAGTATWGDLYPAIVNAVMDVATNHYAGTTMQSIVMHPRRWGWILAQMDSEDRSYIGSVNPQNAPGAFSDIAGPEGSGSVAPVGAILGIPVYLDSTIPTTADTDQDRIIVGAFHEAHLFSGVPVFGVSTEAEFLKDQTIVKVTQDVAFTAERYPAAFSVVSGTALNDTA